GDLPAPDQVINGARGARQEFVSLAEGQFVDVVKVGRKSANAIFAAIIHRRVPEEIRVGVVERAGPGEIALEQQAIRESLLATQLQRMVLRRSVVAEVLDG